MRLTSLDIHQKEFHHKLKGYNEEEVDKFLDQVADEVDRLRKENIELSEKLESADERVRQYQEMERTLHNTLLAAQRSSEDILDRARQESQAILRDAEVKAKEIIHAALTQKQRVQGDFMRLKETEQEFRAKFRDLLEGMVSRLVEIPVPEDVRAMQERAEEPVDLGFAEPAGLTEQDPQAVLVTEPEREAAGEATKDADDEVALWEAEEDEAEAEAEEDEAEAEPHGMSGELIFTSPEHEDEDEEETSSEEPPASGFVTSLSLGEVGPGPDLAAETPDFGEPVEFDSVLGEREDDVDVEEID